jgi:tetratricopeptide (TPR) repeat protein
MQSARDFYVRTFSRIALVGCCISLYDSAAEGGALEEAERLFRTGQYEQCAALAAREMSKDEENERWSQLKIKAEMTNGKYEVALASAESSLRQFPSSLALHLLAREVCQANGRDRDADAMLKVIEQLVTEAPHRYGTPEDRLVLGRFLLVRGADARKVLDQFYDVAMKESPDFVDAYLATVELALAKEDYSLAAETLRKAPKAAAEEPRFHFLTARTFELEDRARSAKALAEALKINKRHVDSLLLEVDLQIDSEAYDDADRLLKQVFDVNPAQPLGWAYKAVLAHLRGKADEEASTRHSALAHWSANPEVDHLIGRKLSQKYRFTEGASAQRRALELDADYLPAKVQLCQDLLRLGQEDEGWKLAGDVFARDGYSVVAYNLITLHDRLSGFRTLTEGGFVVRMDPHEADLYGRGVVDLLGRARKTLCEKYGVELHEPVIVEIFPRRNEFAVRTFGMPGADGFLGVCFGRVITATSPASRGDRPSNWESVLWHEFCHVVTLTKTHNKMPRWLSEGISVYEEGCQDPTWAKASSPQFRTMMLSDEFTPLSRLSSAFLNAKSSQHLQFAYYESALAVEFLVERFGLPALRGLLEDLGAGISLGQALPGRARMSLKEIDRQFTQFARRHAESIAPGATWEEVDLPEGADSAALTAWLEKHPNSFDGLRRLGTRLLSEQKWPQAREVLKRLRAIYPKYVGPENAYMSLAVVHRHMSDPAAERQVLEDLAATDGDASPAYLRLLELAESGNDWKGVMRNAQRLMAVNPLIPAPHRQLALSAEHLGQRELAIQAYRSLLLIDQTDPAETHYRLATLLRDAGNLKDARREVLKTLEEAPRFVDAHRLLLELVDKDGQGTGVRPSSPHLEGGKP